MNKYRVNEEQLLYRFTPYIEVHYASVIFGTENKEINICCSYIELISMKDVLR